MNAPKPLTGTTIRFLQQHSSSAVLVEVDGTWQAHASLPADLADDAIVVRTDARRWADELVDAARDAALESGTSTALGTLRAVAAREGTAELLAERAREEAVATPRPRPVVRLHPRGRHAAPQSPATTEAETHALCQLLDELDEAGLLRAA